ncbi:MAG: bifunctional diaminohydroxyphosphoribosylaminopyrimidine deaminase/5-amino-6-(5-phosphoribosylamino)uracil reductase RibD [Planctomycetota bacterium]|nr:bifunctional diaminohydroxyphosphoribosylaminopyrimidine deaminase/5-amino-6-(5-phosphoribosylamino)uracil reductase RibD [Planctomycetota bacterium]
MPASETMRRAAALAARGRFRVEPNPAVGCVLVRNGRVVGEGFHGWWGGPHAEVAALRAAGPKARGATVYVTLEPCAHRGKTPPCTDALIKARVAEVVYAHADPNPETAGKGPARLRAAGIGVRRVRATKPVRRLLEPYLRHMEQGGKRPWVIAKWAMTLDGRIATRQGDSHWVSSSEARKWAHRNLRATIDAILCGSGTVRADDPSLTNRSGRGPQPLRVIVCGRRALWPQTKVLTDGGKTLLAIPGQFRAPKGAETVVCGRAWRVEPRRLLRTLYKRGVRRLMIEGGGELLGSFFDAALVDQVAAFVAPKVIGGISAVQAVAGKGRAKMQDALKLDAAQWTELGPDRLVEGYLSS